MLVYNRSPQQFLPPTRLLPPLPRFKLEPSFTACQVRSNPMRESTWHMPPRRRRCCLLSPAAVESTACSRQQRPMPQHVLGLDLQVLCQPSTAQQSAASLHRQQKRCRKRTPALPPWQISAGLCLVLEWECAREMCRQAAAH